MTHDLDFGKSLQDLDGHDWGEATGPTHLVVECHRLRRVPVDQLTGDNLRMLIAEAADQIRDRVPSVTRRFDEKTGKPE